MVRHEVRRCSTARPANWSEHRRRRVACARDDPRRHRSSACQHQRRRQHRRAQSRRESRSIAGSRRSTPGTGGAAPRALDEPRRQDDGDAELEHQRLDADRHSVRRLSPTRLPPASCRSRAASCRTPASTTSRTTWTAPSHAFPSDRRRARTDDATVPTKTINLLLGGTALANYDPISGAGFSTSGALPIQTPVSPNGKYVVTANTLTGDDHHHRYRHRRTGQGPAVQRRMPRREFRREERRRLLRLRVEQILERPDRRGSRSER